MYFYAHRVFLFLLTVLRIDTNVHAYACFHVHKRTTTQTLKDFISDLKHTLRKYLTADTGPARFCGVVSLN